MKANATAAERTRLAWELVAAIHQGMEDFYVMGRNVQRIADEELYRELGYPDFLSCCKGEFGWAKAHVYRLMKAAEYRQALPQPPVSNLETGRPAIVWTEGSVRELTRIPDKRIAARVAAKVVQAVKAASPDVKSLKPPASLVRKHVDAELGVDRAAKAKETKRKHEEAQAPDLRRFLVDLTGRTEAEREKLASVADDAWRCLTSERPGLLPRLLAAGEAFVAVVRQAHALGGHQGRNLLPVPRACGTGTNGSALTAKVEELIGGAAEEPAPRSDPLAGLDLERRKRIARLAAGLPAVPPTPATGPNRRGKK